LGEYTSGAFEFHLQKKPLIDTRIRLPENQTIGSLSPLELLEKYLLASHVDPEDIDELKKLALEILREPDNI